MDEQAVDLIGSLAWPVAVLVVVLLFFRPLKQLLARDDVQVQGPGGFSISASNRQAAAAALVQASRDKQDAAPDIDIDRAHTEIDVAASGVEALHSEPHVLWVDDRPSNNRYESAALEALGMHVELSTSTDDALEKVKARRYDVIISDMGRPPDKRAGYTLLEKLRSTGDATPFIIYAASRDPEDFDEAVRRGAVGCTNRPNELIEMVTNALRSQTRR
jgi:CheY-like chemotaxis protein